MYMEFVGCLAYNVNSLFQLVVHVLEVAFEFERRAAYLGFGVQRNESLKFTQFEVSENFWSSADE